MSRRSRRNPQAELAPGVFEELFNKGALDVAKWSIASSGASADNVNLDDGMLRLKLDGSIGAEVKTVDTFGYGTYEFVVRPSSTAAGPYEVGDFASGNVSNFSSYLPGSPAINFSVESTEQGRDNWNHHAAINGLSDFDEHTRMPTIRDGFSNLKWIWSEDRVLFFINGAQAEPGDFSSTIPLPPVPPPPPVPAVPKPIILSHLGTSGVDTFVYVSYFRYTPLGAPVVEPPPEHTSISFLSAGDDQTAICAPYVHLTAVVTTADITTHETLWEQIKGSAITLLGNPNNTLLISYAQTSIQDDKIFRFWVDRGTVRQQFRDVLIYGGPVEQFYLKTLGDNSVSLFSSYNQITSSMINQVTSSMMFAAPAPFTYDVGPVGVSVIDSTALMLYWTLPTSPVGVLQQSAVRSSTGGAGYQQLAIIPSSQPNFYMGANNTDLFRVDLTYIVSRVPQTYIGQPTRLVIGHTLHTVDRITAGSGSTIVDTQVTYSIRTKIEVTYSDALLASISGDVDVSSISSTYTTRTLIANTYLENASAISSIGDASVSGIITTVVLKTRLSVGG